MSLHKTGKQLKKYEDVNCKQLQSESPLGEWDFCVLLVSCLCVFGRIGHFIVVMYWGIYTYFQL